MILLIRANHANAFELQNYAPIAEKLGIKVITTSHPLTELPIEGIPLWSPTELPNFAFRRQILNRLIGGEQWMVGLEKIIDTHSVESIQRNIIHTAETYTPYTHQAVQLRKAGKIDKLVCTCWETIPHANEKFARLRKWKQQAYRYVDLFHTPTQRAKQALVTEGLDPAKIVVIPYGVDLTRFHPMPLRSIAKRGHRPLILTVARLESEKGMEEIEAVASALPRYDFLVVGQGSRSPVGKNIKVYSVPYESIPKVYQSADLFFLPSRKTKTWEEQYGLCLVEAMATGLPVVASDSGAIPEVVGAAGITLPVRNVDKMVKTIRNILTHPDEKKKLSQLALARARSHYDSRKIATKLATLYK